MGNTCVYRWQKSEVTYTSVEVKDMIGERLKEVRNDHKDTQQMLADKLQVSGRRTIRLSLKNTFIIDAPLSYTYSIK
jgi:hypothetical protein